MTEIVTESNEDGSVVTVHLTEVPRPKFSFNLHPSDLGVIATELLSRGGEAAGKNPRYSVPKPQDGQIRMAKANAMNVFDFSESDDVIAFQFVFGEAVLNIALPPESLSGIAQKLMLLTGDKKKRQ